MECDDGLCVGKPLEECIDLMLCLYPCLDNIEMCEDACYTAASPDAVQNLEEMLDCTSAHCMGGNSDDYSDCAKANCLESYTACMAGPFACSHFFSCPSECMEGKEGLPDDEYSDAMDLCFYKCRTELTLDAQEELEVFLTCVMETCPDADSDCLTKSTNPGEPCYNPLKVCQGLKEGCEETSDCDPDEYCAYGVCTNDKCPQGELFCEDGDVLRCNDEGSASELELECGDLECLDGECTMEQSDCSTNDECASEQYCPEGGGACKPDICAQGTKFCQAGDVHACSADGSTELLLEQCGDDSCADGACVPSCTEDAECPEEQYCSNGACADDVCPQGTTFCKEGDVYACNASGSQEILLEECAADCADGACL